MRAVNTLSCILSPPAPAITTSTGRPFIVSAKPRKNINYNDHDHEYDETDNSPELEMLKQQQEMEVSVTDSEKISGSAVLLALQKASAQKTVKMINKKKKSKNMKDEEDKVRNDHQGDGSVVDYSNVKPLRIKSDWKVRLDELESEVQQFFSQ